MAEIRYFGRKSDSAEILVSVKILAFPGGLVSVFRAKNLVRLPTNRVTLVVEYLGRVDLDFGCSTILLWQ